MRASFDNVATATGTPPVGAERDRAGHGAGQDEGAEAAEAAEEDVKKKHTPKVVSHKKPKATG